MAWLLMITRSRCLDRKRSRAAQPVIATELETLMSRSGDPEADAVSRQRARVLGGLMGELPPEQRVLIEMAFFKGMTQSELASALDLPLGTIKTRMRLGMSKLRALADDKLEARGRINHG